MTAENNVEINKNAGLRGRRFVIKTELTLNETCQNPDGIRELLALSGAMSDTFFFGVVRTPKRPRSC
jgi:hypothetical protein